MKSNIKDNGVINDVPESKTMNNGKPMKDLSKCLGYSNRLQIFGCLVQY